MQSNMLLSNHSNTTAVLRCSVAGLRNSDCKRLPVTQVQVFLICLSLHLSLPELSLSNFVSGQRRFFLFYKPNYFSPPCFQIARPPAVTDLSCLGLSHSSTDTAYYLHALSQQRRGRWGRVRRRRGRDTWPGAVCTCSLIGPATNILSFPPFSSKFFNSLLHISYSANENKHSPPPRTPPDSFVFLLFLSSTNFHFVPPQQRTSSSLPLF